MVFSLAYCQEEHLVLQAIFGGNVIVIYNNFE